MGVRITGPRDESAALYDSVTGIAFGPVFEDWLEAQAFLDWLKERGHEDARALSAATLVSEHDAWTHERYTEGEE